MIETCSSIKGYRRTCQDAAGIFDLNGGLVLVVADGAGGIEDGEIAARTVVDCICQQAREMCASTNWAQVLSHIDLAIPSGHSTACVVELSSGRLRGASVGDSQIGILEDDDFLFPSEGQVRKPLLGSREAVPRPFEASWSGSMVVLGTDGFWNYVKKDRILSEMRHVEFPLMAHELAEMARMPSGGFPDDVAVICARRKNVFPAYQRIDLLNDL